MNLFPSESWIAAYKDALNASAEYRDAASSWRHGAIALVVLPEPSVGLGEPFGMWLDVEGGACRGAWRVSLEEARAAPYCITGTYERWRAVIANRLDPIAAMVTRRLELRGNLLVMMRYVFSAKAMVRCATQVPTLFREAA